MLFFLKHGLVISCMILLFVSGQSTLKKEPEVHRILRHGRKCVGVVMSFSPDSKTLATGNGDDGTIKLWDVANGKNIVTFEDRPSNNISLAFSPDSKRIVSAGHETIKLWDVSRVKSLHSPHYAAISRMAAFLAP